MTDNLTPAQQAMIDDPGILFIDDNIATITREQAQKLMEDDPNVITVDPPGKQDKIIHEIPNVGVIVGNCCGLIDQVIEQYRKADLTGENATISNSIKKKVMKLMQSMIDELDSARNTILEVYACLDILLEDFIDFIFTEMEGEEEFVATEHVDVLLTADFEIRYLIKRLAPPSLHPQTIVTRLKAIENYFFISTRNYPDVVAMYSKAFRMADEFRDGYNKMLDRLLLVITDFIQPACFELMKGFRKGGDIELAARTGFRLWEALELDDRKAVKWKTSLYARLLKELYPTSCGRLLWNVPWGNEVRNLQVILAVLCPAALLLVFKSVVQGDGDLGREILWMRKQTERRMKKIYKRLGIRSWIVQGKFTTKKMREFKETIEVPFIPRTPPPPYSPPYSPPTHAKEPEDAPEGEDGGIGKGKEKEEGTEVKAVAEVTEKDGGESQEAAKQKPVQGEKRGGKRGKAAKKGR